MTAYFPDQYGILLHQLRLIGDSEPMAVTMGVRVPDTNAVPLADVVSAAHIAFGDNMIQNLSNQYSLFSTELRLWVDGPSTTSDPVVYAYTSNYTGLNQAGPLPQNSAVLFHKRTARAGRRGRGRFYLPGILEAGVSAVGGLDSGSINAYQAGATAYLARFGVGNLGAVEPVLIHSFDPLAGPPVPSQLVPDRITSLSVDPVIATQRRRLRK